MWQCIDIVGRRYVFIAFKDEYFNQVKPSYDFENEHTQKHNSKAINGHI